MNKFILKKNQIKLLLYHGKQPDFAANDQITLADDSRYFYTVKPFEMTDILGNVIAVLQEYSFIKEELNNVSIFYKLYKTKDDSWYDMEEPKLFAEKAVTRMLKSAFDEKEK